MKHNTLFLLNLFIFFFAFVIKINAQEYTTDANTVLLLHMNETSGNSVSDASEFGNNGTATGTTIINGKFGKGRSFNGTTDGVTIANSPSLQITNNLTLECWINASSFNAGTIISKGTTHYRTYAIYLASDQRGLIFEYSTGGVEGEDISSNVSVQLGEWTHIAVTWTSGLVKFYVNGNLVNSVQANSTTLLTDQENLYIGSTSSGPHFDGAIDEVRISNKARQLNEFNVNDDLVAYYPFNGNANDESGNGNNGTVEGATLTTDRFGNANSAYYFNGSNNFINCGHNPSLQLTNAVSISAWVKTPGGPQIGSYIIGKVAYNQPSYEYSLEFEYPVPGLKADAGGENYDELTTNFLPADSQWYHITATWEYPGLFKVYKNGELLNSMITTSAIEPTDEDVAIGCVRARTDEYFARYFLGMIDDIRIYNRAITLAEIDSLYHEGGYDPSLVAYYPFNGNANDESDYGNNGTVNGATLTTDRFGNANSAYSFNGSNNFINCGHNTSLQLTNAVTISAWFKTPEGPKIGSYIIGKVAYDQPSYEYSLEFELPVPGLKADVGGENYDELTTNFLPTDSQWYHVAVTWEYPGLFKIYKNGELLNSMATTSAIEPTNEDVAIGCVRARTDEYFARYFLGMIDDIRIYNRALSASEIDSLYVLPPDVPPQPQDTVKFRTFKQTVRDFTQKTVKLQYKRGQLKSQPNIMTAVENVFAKQVSKSRFPKGRTFLGIQRLDSAKYYAWIDLKKASDLAKGFTNEHTGQAYPLDYLRNPAKGTKKKLNKAVKFTSSLNNPAIAEGMLFKLNILASDSGITPQGFGNLTLDTTIILAGRNLKGTTMYQIANYFDSIMTFWGKFGIDSTGDYVNLGAFVQSVLKPINEGFYDSLNTTATISNRNYTVDSVKIAAKNIYAVTLKGIKTASDIHVVKYVSGTKEENHFSEAKPFTPNSFALHQNYPNPFNPTTTIRFSIPVGAIHESPLQTTLKIYNVLGQEVATLLNNETMEEGEHEIQFDASGIVSGMYFYRLTAGSFVETRKMLLLK
ncbi:MAG: T9SS type A sorting domain-containing protein [Ignavibacteriales bacterium]|nr:T9SS type A sorting domain-containing protein [Ignavibacteriales bacterium]